MTITSDLTTAQAAAQKAVTDANSYVTASKGTSTYWYAIELLFDATAILEDINLAITAAAPPPPPAPAKPAAGWWDNSPEACPVTQTWVLDYGYGSDSNEYTEGAAAAWTAKGWRLAFKIGNASEAQVVALASALVAGGQTRPLIMPMWENNQGTKDWFQSWNELTMTAAEYLENFNNIVSWFEAQPGTEDFTYGYNPNVNQAGNQAPGRNQFDTIPAARPNLIGILDGYDNPTGNNGPACVAQAQAYLVEFQEAGIPFWGFAEWGPNDHDDPGYITSMLTWMESVGAVLQILFSDPSGSFDSELDATKTPQMLAAYEAFYAPAASPLASSLGKWAQGLPSRDE